MHDLHFIGNVTSFEVVAHLEEDTGYYSQLNVDGGMRAIWAFKVTTL